MNNLSLKTNQNKLKINPKGSPNFLVSTIKEIAIYNVQNVLKIILADFVTMKQNMKIAKI